MRLIIAYCTDWAVYAQQTPKTTPYDIERGYVAGILINETPDAYIIAHHEFNGGDCRHVTALPKVNVSDLWAIDLPVNPADWPDAKKWEPVPTARSVPVADSTAIVREAVAAVVSARPDIGPAKEALERAAADLNAWGGVEALEAGQGSKAYLVG